MAHVEATQVQETQVEATQVQETQEVKQEQEDGPEVDLLFEAVKAQQEVPMGTRK